MSSFSYLQRCPALKKTLLSFHLFCILWKWVQQLYICIKSYFLSSVSDMSSFNFIECPCILQLSEGKINASLEDSIGLCVHLLFVKKFSHIFTYSSVLQQKDSWWKIQIAQAVSHLTRGRNILENNLALHQQKNLRMIGF